MIFIALFVTCAFWWFLLLCLVSFLLEVFEFLSGLLVLVLSVLVVVVIGVCCCFWLHGAVPFCILVLFYCCPVSVLVLWLPSFEWSSSLQIIEKKSTPPF